MPPPPPPRCSTSLANWRCCQHFHSVGCGALREQALTPYFDLVLTCNRGISFGLLSGTAIGDAIFATTAVVVIVGLLFWLSRVRDGLLAIGLGLVVGGAIGNVVDRLRLGGVIDFLYFHAGSWYWPAFNLADSAICLGVAAMLIDGLCLRRAPRQANRGEDAVP